MATYTNTHTQYDCAINGIPFFMGPSAEFPYVRESAEFQRQQIDSTNEPGEQSLTSWWYRSQSSFHLGAGQKFYDPIRGDQTSQYRFYDSAGVDVFTKGEVSLLKKTTRVDTTSSWGDMVGWSYAGDSGLLYEDGYDLYCYKVSTGAATEVLYEGAASGSDNIWDIDVSSEKYFVISNAGIYRGTLPDGNGTHIYNVPGAGDRGYVKWAKDKLFVTIDEKIYIISDISPGSPTTLATTYAGDGDSSLLYTHTEAGWTWNGIEAGPDCVFFSGYAGTSSSIHGHKSSIYASTLEVANVDDAPQVTQPVQVAELPHGEFILGMVSYLGTYLILSTTKGVRVCAIGQSGQLQVGPLSIELDNYSYYACVWDRFVYAAGAVVDGYDGVYKLDLSAPVDDTGLRFAYAKDKASGHSSASTGYPARVAMMGTTGRLAIMVDNSGVWVEHATDLVSSGWIQTGEIRFDTWTEKLFQYLRTAMDRTKTGTIRPYWINEAGTSTALAAATSTSGVPYLDTMGSDGTARVGVSYYWALAQYSATAGPTFRGYQVRGLPANVKQRELRLPLLCFRRERLRTGRTVERSTWDRIAAIEALERAGTVVPYQNYLTGESVNVTVEKTQFVADRPVQSAAEGADPGGMLVVTLRTADTMSAYTP